jgi:hypothetical protein
VTEEQITGVEGFGFEGGAVTGNEQPMVNLIAEQFNATQGWKVAAQGAVGGVGGLGENEPEAVVMRRLGVVPEHADDAVCDVDREAGKHAADLRLEWGERFQNERERRLWFRLGMGGARHEGLDATIADGASGGQGLGME